MKKKLLIISFLSLVFSLKAQTNVYTYVGSNGLMTVQDETTVYNGGGWQNAAKGTGTTGGKVKNTGDIMVVGTPANDKFDVASDAEFRLVYSGNSGSTIYGQLYINGIKQAAILGKVVKEFKSDVTNSAGTGATTGQQQIGLPFYKFTTTDLKAAIDKGNDKWLNLSNNTLTGMGRFASNAVFRWNNTKAVFDQVLDSETYTSANNGIVDGTYPAQYYAIPVVYKNGVQWWFPQTILTEFKGTPASDQESFITVPLKGGAAEINFGTNGSAINMYRERYNTYLNDPFRSGSYGGTTPWAADYGKFLYQYANPFLTNLDLNVLYDPKQYTGTPPTGYIPVDNLYGIAFYKNSSNTYQTGVGSKVNSNVEITLTSGGSFQLGNLNLLIKPLGTFLIKLTAESTTNNILNLANNLRIFKNTPRTLFDNKGPTSARVAGTGKTAVTTPFADPSTLAKQVAVILYDSTNNEIGRTYYGVTPSAITGYNSSNFLQAYNDASPIYTSEELATGGADVSQSSKIYINVANQVDFAGKAMPLTVAATNASYVKFELYEGGQRLANTDNFSNGTNFYFEKDKNITKIYDGDTIPVTASSYNLYYERPRGLANTGVVTGETIIGKYDNDYAIRFSNKWSSAKVEVYSAAGQLIFSRDNISTASDFIIPLNTNSNGLFLVKATSEKGEVVLKKILK